MAHSWVQMFPSEYEAFKAYAEINPNNCTLLVDTYNVLKSGVPNAIKVFKELSIAKCAIRLDSGDITYLSKKARIMLDEAGYANCKIVASNSLDEHIIRDILNQGAQVDSFGVGERLITSESDPVFGGVYKLVAIEDEKGNIIPKIKISENPSKITTPHFKKVYGVYCNDMKKAEADIICVHDEVIDDSKPITIFDPDYTWKKKTYENYTVKELLVPIFRNGECVYERPSVKSIKKYCEKQIAEQWDEVKRFDNPHNYYVDLSDKLWAIKQDMLKAEQR
jgi:nicotinate phosphoribosyltransferase